ncbi:MAG: HAD-IA family hydrolase [Candidatus Korobacteraceae bacterium]
MLLAARNSSAARTYDVIIFDLDGVVIDSIPDLVAALRHSLHQVGSSDRDPVFVRSCIGGGARNILLRCLDENKKERIDEAMQTFRAYYEENCTNQTTLFPGVREILEFYSGKTRLALATFKIRPATLKILTQLDVLKYFEVVITADDVQRPKPDPECINRILNNLHSSRDAAILIGDTPTDVSTGKNAGISTCAVLYGIGTRRELDACEPDFIVESILDLKQIVVM